MFKYTCILENITHFCEIIQWINKNNSKNECILSNHKIEPFNEIGDYVWRFNSNLDHENFTSLLVRATDYLGIGWDLLDDDHDEYNYDNENEKNDN